MFLEMLFTNGGGGQLVETTLWTNPNTGANYSGGTASLSDDIDNYDYVGVYYKFTPSSDDSTATCQYMKVADFKKDNSVTGNDTFAITMRGSSNWWARRVSYSSDTEISISTAYAYGAAQTANNIAIPVKIVGMKLSGGGGSLNPTATYKEIRGNVTDTYTVESGKHYIFFVSYQTTGSLASAYEIYNGTVTTLYNGTGTRVTITISGTTMSVKNASTSARLDTILVQLD